MRKTGTNTMASTAIVRTNKPAHASLRFFLVRLSTPVEVSSMLDLPDRLRIEKNRRQKARGSKDVAVFTAFCLLPSAFCLVPSVFHFALESDAGCELKRTRPARAEDPAGGRDGLAEARGAQKARAGRVVAVAHENVGK